MKWKITVNHGVEGESRGFSDITSSKLEKILFSL
jgi:hypothetical protein